jgi:hypothetical protein
MAKYRPMAKRCTVNSAWRGLWVGLVIVGCGASDDSASGDSGDLNGLESSDDADESPAPVVSEPSRPAPSGAATDAPSGAATGALPPAESPSFAPSDGAAYDVPGLPPPVGPGGNGLQPGTLTAGAWDDSQNLERFLEYKSELESNQVAGMPLFEEEAHRDAAARAAQPLAHTTLDIALVIDTTGSMGDELAYLQTEFDALSSAIEAQYPQAEQRWALVLYRDEGDEYVTRTFDFEAAGAAFRDRLGAQSAGGGGDYPEAPDAALAAMNQLSWRSDPTTARLAFWVGDAPHHIDRAGALAAAVEVAASQDVHLYPVASSGVDELTEYAMRSAAQLTLGRYLFLTDDSGVGGEHKEPTIPCYFVTRLDAAIVRMVDIEMSGVYHEPAAAEVIRSGGDPADGACRLESGQTVLVF